MGLSDPTPGAGSAVLDVGRHQRLVTAAIKKPWRGMRYSRTEDQRKKR
jgi:hypothetical protein